LITASSANVAGAPPPIAPDSLDATLAAHVDLIIDAGACPGGLPSTVVGVRGDGVAILRSGAIAVEDIARALGRDVEVLG
jgi:L-threonylcarbamoyladenylate synthase